MAELMITIYRDFFDLDKPFYKDITEVLSYIKSGRWRNQIHAVRLEQDKAEKRKLKNKLPCICFSGMFKERKDEALIQHSGIIVLDFDHVEDLPGLINQINSDPHTYASFTSPSGDGLKVLVRIPPVPENHRKAFAALKQKYPNIDSSGVNESRICFASWDENLYLNENSEVYLDIIDEKIKPKNVVVNEYAVNTDYAKLQIALDIIRNAKEGEKHYELIKASRLVGGFISGGIVQEDEAIRLLELEINKKGIDDFRAAQKTINDGIEFGKREPIYSNKNFSQACKNVVSADIIIDGERPKDVVTLDDVNHKMDYNFDNGTSMGETTYFPEIDEAYRMKRGEITLVHGIANHGKSTFLYHLLVVKAIKDGYKFGIFSPENLPEEEFYTDLVEIYIGKTSKKGVEGRMSREEFNAGKSFINNHFFLIYPQNDAPTPEYINNRFRELIIKRGIDGCVIDPYNQLDNDIKKTGGREDQYISLFATQIKRFAIEMKVFYFVVAHPKGGLSKVDKDYECPDVYELAGGAMWSNKFDNIFAIHRPNRTSDPKDSIVHFVSQKIKKQKTCGKPGTVILNYLFKTNRYYQQDGFSPLGMMPQISSDIFYNKDATSAAIDKIMQQQNFLPNED